MAASKSKNTVEGVCFPHDVEPVLIVRVTSALGEILKSPHVAIHICDVVGQAGARGLLVAR